jgi:glutathionylspermidine synthase
MKEIDQNLSREELRVKMCELQDEAQMYRKAIDRIDRQRNEEYRKSILNHCFYCDHTWIRIENFDLNYEPHGTRIYDYENEIYELDFKATIWEDDINEANEISHEEFNAKLLEARSLIKL